MNKGPVPSRRVPPTRDVPSELRGARLLAARRHRHGSIPRIAILLGHWDGGDQVQQARQLYAWIRRNRHGNEGDSTV